MTEYTKKEKRKWWYAPNLKVTKKSEPKDEDIKKGKELRETAKQEGWTLPTWANYGQSTNFTYTGHGVVKDILNPDDKPTIREKKKKKTIGEFDYEEEVEEYNISPYLTSEKKHPLPDTGKQKEMMKSTQSWSREGPLEPKQGLETDKKLQTSVRGKNAKKKLEKLFTEIQEYDQREFDHRILPVRTGFKHYQWALYVGPQKGERTSKRVRVKGGRNLKLVDVEAVENVSCPTCNRKPKRKCINKNGKELDFSKTHVSRVKKYMTEIKGEKWGKRSEFKSPSHGGYRGDTGI